MTRRCFIALFTCASMRDLYLELCSDMTTDTFLLALQRFAGRRGLPHTIYTDNAHTFHTANRKLTPFWQYLTASSIHNYLSQYIITWKCIAPRAAWWERMIGTTKQCLRIVLGKTKMREEGQNTVLIETAINSRPISQDGND